MKKYATIFIVIIGIVLLYINYNPSENIPDKKPGLEIVNEFKINIPEPSGIAFSDDGKDLWIVSDQNSQIYLCTFEGIIKDSLKVKGMDLEGITVINDSTILIVLERKRTIVKLLINGTELSRLKLDLRGELNSGLEGITYNKNNGHIYIINEKRPKLLLELNENNEIVRRTEINFAKDFSGIFYDESSNLLWLISDESSAIFKCTLLGEELEKYYIHIPQIEGIAVNSENKLVYLVSDKTEKLYVLKIN